LNKERTKIWQTALALAVTTLITGCGTGADQQVQAICSEANSAMAENDVIDVITGSPDSDWNGIATDYYDLKVELLDLSDRASDVSDTQLARDLASVSRSANSIFSAASLIATVGLNSLTFQELQDRISDFTNNEALRSPGDRTFIACN
jgi:hypothetical protein